MENFLLVILINLKKNPKLFYLMELLVGGLVMEPSGKRNILLHSISHQLNAQIVR
jgi:hypothetical protein